MKLDEFPLIPLLRREVTIILRCILRQSVKQFPLIPLLRREVTIPGVIYRQPRMLVMFPLIPLLRREVTDSRLGLASISGLCFH